MSKEEMLESNSLTDILNKKIKYAVREVTTYLDYDAALEALEIQEQMMYLDTLIANEEKSNQPKSITEDSSEYQKERDELGERLVELNPHIQDSRVVWTVQGIAPKVWKIMDKKARQKFPLAKEADDHTKVETQVDRNEFINVETIRKGIVKVEFADGTVIQGDSISHEEALAMWNEMPTEATQAVKEKIDELTFSTRSFHEEIESADFLSNN